MKKMLAALALSLTLVLTGCGSSEEATDNSGATSSPSPSPSATETQSLPDKYLEVVRAKFPALEDIDEKTILAVPRAACKALDQGATLEDVLVSLTDGGLPPYQAGYMVGAGIPAFCPQHENLIPSGDAGI